jgi:hypothetical protein
MWYVIQARFCHDDEDDLFIREADTEQHACEALEAQQREERERPLCDECKDAVEAGESTGEVTEGCDECVPFYITNTIECETEPGKHTTHKAAENAAEIALSLDAAALAEFIDGPEIGESKHMMIVTAVTEAALALTQLEGQQEQMWGNGADWYLTCDAIAARIIDNPRVEWTASDMAALVVRD